MCVLECLVASISLDMLLELLIYDVIKNLPHLPQKLTAQFIFAGFGAVSAWFAFFVRLFHVGCFIPPVKKEQRSTFTIKELLFSRKNILCIISFIAYVMSHCSHCAGAGEAARHTVGPLSFPMLPSGSSRCLGAIYKMGRCCHQEVKRPKSGGFLSPSSLSRDSPFLNMEASC